MTDDTVPAPREFDLVVALLLLAGAGLLMARAGKQLERLRLAAKIERNRRLDAESEVERHLKNMDGALQTIGELSERVKHLERAGAPAAPAGGRKPARARPPAAGKPPAGGDG